MSVLNYATSVSDLFKINLDYDLSNIGSWADNDKRKIIFTGDKHIITHGVDLLADFNGNRGLVPKYPTSGDLFTQIGDYGILGKTGWIKLTTNHLPVSTTITNDDLLIPTNSAVYNYVANQIGAGFAANDAMLFVGTFNGEGKELENYNTNIITDSDIELDNGKKLFINLKNYKAGWTFRVSTKAGKFGNKDLEIGDMLICVSDYATEFKESDWQIIQTNINGLTTVKINNTPFYIYTNSVLPETSFYAPTEGGTEGYFLKSKGTDKIPVWEPPSNITVGYAGDITTNPELITDNNKIKVKVGTKTSLGITVPFATTAAKVANTLTIGTGLLLIDDTQASESYYDGSKALTLNLIPASYSNLGGVQIANNGYLKITNGILDFNPDSLNDLLGGGGIEGVKYTLNTSTINSTTSSLNLTGKLGTSSVSFLGINIGITSTSTTNDQGNIDYGIKFTLNQATSSLLGGVKLMRTALTSSINLVDAPESYDTGRNYAVDLDKDGKMFVNVPWREIRVNNKSIRNSILNIVPSSDIVMSYENEETGDLGNDGIATISFKLGIFNLSENKWEYDN